MIPKIIKGPSGPFFVVLIGFLKLLMAMKIIIIRANYNDSLHLL